MDMDIILVKMLLWHEGYGPCFAVIFFLCNNTLINFIVLIILCIHI